jgi:hypothetical protein
VAVGSLILCEYASRTHSGYNFYWAITRAWELAVGSLCSFASIRRDRLRDEVLSWIGISAIIGSVFLFNSNIRFPSAYALIPVVGSALVLLFCVAPTLSARVLSLKPMVGIGLISYSAYLWHQPIFVFCRIFPANETIFSNEILMVTIAFGLLSISFLSWRYVEMPFRQRNLVNVQTLVAVLSPVAACMALFSVYGMSASSWFSHGDESAMKLAKFFDNSHLGYYVREGISDAYHDECNFMDVLNYGEAGSPLRKGPLPIRCYTRDDKFKHAAFIWGDSHGAMLRFGLQAEIPRDWQLLQVTTSGCRPAIDDEASSKLCSTSNSFARDSIAKAKPDVVVVSQGTGHNLDDMNKIYDTLIRYGVKKVVFTGSAPIWRHSLPEIILARFWPSVPDRTWLDIDKSVVAHDERLRHAFSDDKTRHFVSLINIFCDNEGCMTHIGGDIKNGITSFDEGHLTPAASVYLSQHGLASALTGSVD